MDKTRHKRGPFSPTQIQLLVRIGTVTQTSAVFSEEANQWSVFESCDSMQNELAVSLGEQRVEPEAPSRLSLANIPPMESTPCQDSACPNSPSCDVVYIWDREGKLWLTFDEYVTLCTIEGLTDGLPERLLAQSPEQLEELLHQADAGGNLSKSKPGDNGKARIEVDDEPLSDPEKEAKRQKRRSYRERKKLRRDAGIWMKGKVNPNVYVSGLPADVSIDELAGLFKQSGQLKADLETGAARVKLYGNGDALISYMHPESVKLAIERFDEYEIRPGCLICVQEADFTLAAEPQDADAPKLTLEELEMRAQLNREKRRKLMEYHRKERDLKSAWDVSDYRSRVRPVVVFQNCFDPRTDDFIDHEYLETELEKHCARFGDIKKVKSIRDTIDGFICVKFDKVTDAQACIASLAGEDDSEHNLVLNNRRISAFMHDGRDLSSRLWVPQSTVHAEADEPAVGQAEAGGWEDFLYGEEGDSDDSDLQIRTQ